MEYRTLAQLKTEFNASLDLEEEDFVGDSELLTYFNAGIDKVEAKIHQLYEDYFLDEAYLALVSGTSEYALPSGIYASKIRGIVYSRGNLIYPIKRLRTRARFTNIAETRYLANSTQQYMYMLKNTPPVNGQSATGVKLILLPGSFETSSTNVTIWYIRNARRLALDADICDIPEFYHYVLQFARVRVYEKEGHPGLALAKADLQEMENEMITTLRDMAPDDDTEIEQDLSSYYDQSGMEDIYT